ncbi:MAG: hypothetical protein ACTHKQ_00015 [Mesorhizobium sp.]
MNALTFRPIGEVAAFVVEKNRFLRALDHWSKQEPDAFPVNSPPVGALRPSDTDENEILARTFKAIALAGFPTRRMVLLMAAIEVHERRCAIAWDHVKANPNPRSTAPRDGYSALRPYEAMIGVLRDWLEALHDAATEAEP